MDGSKFANVDRSRGQGGSLPDPDENTPGDKNTKVSFRGKCLHESCNDGDEATDSHAPSSAQEICQWATEEEADVG